MAPLRNPDAVLGRFVWHDLMTTDPGAAQSLYAALAGWGTEPWPDPGNPYVMWTVDSDRVGGTMRLPDDAVQRGAAPHWLSYIETPSVDETATEAKKLGATVMVPPTDIPNVGRFAVLSDPQRAQFAIFTPLSGSTSRAGRPRPGDFSWHELATTDAQAALEFYRALFKWDDAGSTEIGGGQQYLMFGQGDVPMGGIYQITDDAPMPTAWLPYIHVKSADGAARALEEHGGQVLNGPMDVPGGDRIVMGRDAQGALVAAHAARETAD